MTGRHERNQLSQISSVVDEELSDYLTGTVKNVYPNLQQSGDGFFQADVYLDDNENNIKYAVKVASSGQRSINVPTAGDRVIVEEDSYNQLRVTNKLWTASDPPPIGRGGMWRREVISTDSSDLGEGNLYLTGYTNYSVNQDTLPDERGYQEFGDPYPQKSDVESSVIQIAKHTNNENREPGSESNKNIEENTAAKVEIKDSKNNDSYISVEISKDGGSDSSITWGMEFNISQGTFKLSDPEGYGIHAKGDGKFDWYHSDINFKESKNESTMNLE